MLLLVVDPFDVWERLFKVSYDLPQWGAWLVVAFAIALASFLAFHDVRSKLQPAAIELRLRQEEARRQERIKRVEPLVMPIIPTLLKLRNEVETTIENAIINSGDMAKIHQVLGQSPSIEEKLEKTWYWTHYPVTSKLAYITNQLLSKHGVGVNNLVTRNPQLKQIVDETDMLRSKSPNKRLRKLIGTYKDKLLYEIGTQNLAE